MPNLTPCVATLLAVAVSLPALVGAPTLAAQEYTVTPLTQPRSHDPTYALPLVPTRTLRFTTDEGTWMSVDVSPDGRTIVFDLLGDLYTVPITGGKATRIMGGMAVDMQPRYSPDGTRIAFVSDRSGQENVWIADADGRYPHPLARSGLDTSTSWKDGLSLEPMWTADGRFILSKGARYAVLTGLPAPLRKADGTPLFPFFGRMAVSGSPRHAYVFVDSGATTLAGLDVYDFTTGRVQPLLRSPRRHIVGVAASRDERWLVYAVLADGGTALRLRDLHTGAERWLAHGLAPAVGGRIWSMIPNIAFTPDGEALVAAIGGKLWRIAVPSGQRTPIPFQADVELDLGPLAQFQYRVRDSLTVRQIREPRLSSDGQRLAFIALDKLYLMDFPHGTPRRATTAAGVVENYPAWSPDGRYVAFSSYSDLEGGHIYRVDVKRVLAAGPRATPERLTDEADLYTRLAYSPDGRRLVFGRSPWRQLQQQVATNPALPVELGWMDAGGGERRRITQLTEHWHVTVDAGAPPQFLTADPDRLVVPNAGTLVSMRWDGSDRRTLLRWPDGTPPFEDMPSARGPQSVPPQVVLSPTGTHALVAYRNNLYLATLPPGPRDSLLIDVGARTPALSLRRISRYGAEFPGWSADGAQAYFALGRSLFVYDLATGEARLRDSLRAADVRRATASRAGRAERAARAVRDTARTPFPVAYTPARHDVAVVVPRHVARGTVALRGARLITMRGDEVIARGDLVIRHGRILAVGPSGTVAIPKGARIIDVTGTTILPGYVDLHAHVSGTYVTHKTQVPEFLAYLAYGVTTTRNPASVTTDFLAYADRAEVGDLLGPRLLATGPAVPRDTDDELTSLAETRDVLRRYAEFYETQTLKQYMAGSRLVRQWIVMASHELGLSPTTEGGYNWRMALTEFLDGYAGHEHSHLVRPLYRDAVLLAAASGITYDPTLVVDHDYVNGDLPPASKLIATERPHDDPKFRRFAVRSDLARLARGAQWAQGQLAAWDEAGRFQHAAELARGAAVIAAAGGRVGVGAHGELPGPDMHWSLWLLGSGGMPNLEVLRAGTLTGARALGLDRDLGSLEPGKLADLQVLEGNPLENLRHTNTLRYVMKDGRLYDADTLDEVWPRPHKLGPQWWQLEAPPAEPHRAAR